jgi:hypothetical protein
VSSSTKTTAAANGGSHWTKLVLINVAVTAGLGLVALLAAEAYLRLTIPSSSGESIYESTLATWRYKVMKGDARIISWGSELRTNRLGFRDDGPEIPAKVPSEVRTIVLGDSFTVSAGVDYDDIHTSVLEQRLREHVPDTTVINLAVGGYNVIQYDLVLHEVGLSLDPDVVVVAVFPYNDLSNDTYRANEADANGTSKPGASRTWHQKLYVYQSFLVKIESRVRALFARPPAAQDAAPAGATAQNTRETDAQENLAALERVVDRATRQGLEVVVALLPNTDTYEDQRSDFSPFVELCQTRGWRCSNLLDRFAAEAPPPKSLRLNVIDAHPNDAYNALIAQFLAEDLLPVVQSVRARRGTAAGDGASEAARVARRPAGRGAQSSAKAPS